MKTYTKSKHILHLYYKLWKALKFVIFYCRINNEKIVKNEGGIEHEHSSCKPWGCTHTHTHTHTLCLLEAKAGIFSYALLNMYIRDG